MPKDSFYDPIKKMFLEDFSKLFETKLLTEEYFDKAFEKYDDSFLETIHFYHFMIERQERNEIKIISMMSIIESLDNDRYMTIQDYLRKKFSEKNFSIESKSVMEKIISEYNSVFGTKNKIKSYLNKYLKEDDVEKIINSIKKWDLKTNKFTKLSKNQDFFDLIIEMRNDFVHRAQYIQMLEDNNTNVSFSATKINKEYYIINPDCNAKHIINLFTETIIKYFVL